MRPGQPEAAKLGFISTVRITATSLRTPFSNNDHGIRLYSSCNNTLTNNTANSNHDYGIWLSYSSDNTLASNTADSNSGNGICLYYSSNNTLASNTANSNNYRGIFLYSSCNHNTLTSNTADSNSGNGIFLYSSCNHNTLTSNNASNNDHGIFLHSSSNNTLTGNNASSNNNDNIRLEYSSNYNTLTSNNASLSGDHGIVLTSSCNHNTLNGNTADSNSGNGIYLHSSSNDNTLTGNTASNNEYDIRLYHSSNNTLTSNTLNGTTVSFAYSGDVSLKGVGAPAADPTGQQTIGKFINATNQSAGAWLFLNFSYSDADVSGLGESNLTVWKHNGTMWLKDGWNGTRYLDTAENVVGVNITSFSVFAPAAPELLGDTTPPVIVITTPVPYRLYTVGMKLDFSATDDESGVATIVGNLTNTIGVSQIVDSGFAPAVGVYTLVVTATDNAGNTNVSDPVFFVVYDSDGGHATGGGWFYPDYESTLPGGKANFGFTARYKNGDSTGKLNFQYKDADIHLKSTSIDWLTISAVSAQFQGTGTINGEGLYTFRVQTKDNGEPGAGSDHFDIKIWDGTDTEADPYHKAKNVLSGGNIQVHKKG